MLGPAASFADYSSVLRWGQL